MEGSSARAARVLPHSCSKQSEVEKIKQMAEASAETTPE